MDPLHPALPGKVIAPAAQAVTSHTIDMGTDNDASYDQTIKVKLPGAGMNVFNRYKLDRILGRGGMGVVWLADDLKLERPVALKFLPSLIGLDPAAVKELKTETRRGLELSHPHIVRIYDFVDDEDAAAISMEFVDGKTLSELRLGTNHGVFTVEQISRWLPGVCDALDYAHFQRKVVHRDLKPANIMLTTKDEVAKVADFGIARSLSDTMSRLSAAHIGTSGTLPYMSPQQAMGERPLPTDDVYSLGATLYELLAGKPPFYRGDLPTQISSKIAPSIIERRQELEIKAADPIPKEWQDAIAACLSKDPNMRPSCAGMLAELLGLKTSTGTARTLRYSKDAFAAKPAAKSKAPLLVIAAVVAIGAGVTWHFVSQKPAAGAVVHTSSPAETEPPPVLGPKTSVTAAKQPSATMATPKPVSPTTQPPAPVVAAAVPTSAPAPTLSPTPAATPAAPGPAAATPGAPGAPMPLTADSAPSVIAASTPPTVPAQVAAPVYPPVPQAGPPPAGAPQMVMVPSGPMQPGGYAPPPMSIPMPPQPIAAEPPAGFWSVDRIFPTTPFSAYSVTGKRYLLYRTQGALKERGLYSSSVDGKEGKGTHNAIQVFQAKNGLRATGLLDIPTLAALQLSTEPDNEEWVPAPDVSSGPRRAPGGGRYGKPSEEEPGFFEKTGGKLKGLFK